MIWIGAVFGKKQKKNDGVFQALRRGKTEDKGGNAPEDWSGGTDGEKGEVGRLKLQVSPLSSSQRTSQLGFFFFSVSYFLLLRPRNVIFPQKWIFN